ncbi:MAG: SDR family oxidoreductase [Gemmatimonadetes bacterium]|nr:SDR family oxidoreductase [Gemmatimonadota bacterium]
MAHDRFSLAGKVALVTGGTRGIGKGIAKAFAEAGAQVMIVSRKEPSVEAAVAELASAGTVRGLAANVARPEEQTKIVDATIAAFGGIDILVNNAATNPLFGPVENTSSEIFDKIMALNLRAPFELAKAVRPHFIARGGGAIINLSSIGGVSPEAGLGIYNVSKAALISLTQVLAREWGKDNIRANVICPGLIKTDFSAALWQNEQILKHMMRGQALTRLADPVDIASLALFLAAEASAFCTGATFMADGGYTI